MRYSNKRDPAQVRGKVLIEVASSSSVLDCDLRIATVNTKHMAFEEVDSDEERRARLNGEKGNAGNG